MRRSREAEKDMARHHNRATRSLNTITNLVSLDILAFLIFN